jgi:hypothetical protein
MISRFQLYSLYKYILLLVFLQSIYAWFLWGTTIYILLIAAVITIILYNGSNALFTLKKKNLLPIILIVIVQLYVIIDTDVNNFLGAIFRIIILCGVFLLKEDFKIDVFLFFNRSMAFILIVSIFFWILYLIGFQLPHTNVDGEYGHYYNYFAFLFLIRSELSFFVFPRFCSIFLEPGYLGMICSYFIIVNNFNLKRNFTWIFLIATILSFSLAAYVVLLIALMLILIFNTQKPILKLFLMGAILFSLYSFFINLYDGDNVFNTYIFKRLQVNDGNISGNNRFSSDLIVYFDTFLNSTNKFFGIGPNHFRKIQWDDGNAGYKVFIIIYGFVGTFLIFLFHYVIARNYNSKLVWILLLSYILIFIQASNPLLEGQLFIFITGAAFIKNHDSHKVL